MYEVLGPSIGPVGLTAPGPAYRPRTWDDTRVIPNTPLRFDMLRRADADLSLRLRELRGLGVLYRDVAGRLVLADGRMELGPVTADLAAGRASLHLVADARTARPAVSLRASFPGVPVQPLLASFSRRDNLFGTVEVDADLAGEGATPRALAASLTGHLGLAIVEGDIDSRLLLDPLADVMRAARLPLNLATVRGSLSRLRCFAARAEVQDGKTQLTALVLESGRILVQGAGGFDLGEESYSLLLRPAIRMVGLPAAVPVRVEGSFLTPRLSLEALEPPQPRPAAGRGRAVPVPVEEDACGPALEAARGGRAGAMPRPADARPAMVNPGPARPVHR